jgi:hypothetical protein
MLSTSIPEGNKFFVTVSTDLCVPSTDMTHRATGKLLIRSTGGSTNLNLPIKCCDHRQVLGQSHSIRFKRQCIPDPCSRPQGVCTSIPDT